MAFVVSRVLMKRLSSGRTSCQVKYKFALTVYVLILIKYYAVAVSKLNDYTLCIWNAKDNKIPTQEYVLDKLS